MAKNPACFELIKSLTKAEKAHFKKYLTYNERKGEPTIYLQLFAELDKLKKYDLNKILHKFRNKKFSKHISTTYNYLYTLLMKSLRDYHADKNIQIKAADILSVNQLGKKVLANRANFKEWRTNFYNYGGTNIGDFRWDARRDELSLE